MFIENALPLNGPKVRVVECSGVVFLRSLFSIIMSYILDFKKLLNETSYESYFILRFSLILTNNNQL